jgi:Lon protease-like protein
LSFFGSDVLLNTPSLITGVHNVTISTATSLETDTRGATIIPFPARKPAEPVQTDPAPAERLARALANLNAALQEQKAAVASWRSAMAELKASTSGLHGSLQAYSNSLGTLGDSVADLRDRARSLEQWADQHQGA